MISSIVLLLIFQFMWLRGAYYDAKEDFAKETNLLFRNTVLAMHDSMIQRSIKPWEQDSVMGSLKKDIRVKFHDSLRSTVGHIEDSVINNAYFREQTTRIEIFSSSSEDSLERILRPLTSRMRNKGPRRFILKLGDDSLKVDSIKLNYRQALDKAGIPVTFDVIKVRTPGPNRIQRTLATPKGRHTSEIVRLNPINNYAVSFGGISGLLFKKITPQILFSLFLTVLTAGSFFIMYKNLQAQQRLMQIKNDFISNVTHELKTPVATVSVALEALQNFNALNNQERTKEYLEIAQNELNRLTLMTDKILKTAVYEDQGVELKFEKVDLDILIQQVLSSMKLVFEKTKTRVTYRKNGTNFILDGSETHLMNVLYNLIDNALKYSRDGSSIIIHLDTPERGKMNLTITDNGIGIPLEYQEKIFEKFFRVPSGDVHDIKGYGLGLSYVNSVIRNHKGKIVVESIPGSGSSFKIQIPTHITA